MLVTSTCLNNLLNPYVLLQQKFENFGRIDSKSAFKKNIYLESLNFEKFFLWYLELFLRISAKTFRRFYVGWSEERGIWRRDSRQPPFLRRVALGMRMSFGGNNGGIWTCAVRLIVLYKRLARKQLNMSLFISPHRKILQTSYNWLCSICRPFY